MAGNPVQHEDLKRGQYKPTIFIGCGGTGAKILQRIRLQALERFGGFSNEELPGVAFLSFDTDQAGQKAGAQDSDLKDAKERTKKLCDFRPDERLNLEPGLMKKITENQATLNQAPHIARWFEPKMLTITNRADAREGAGQMRPLARLVAITNYDRIVGMVEQARSQVKKFDLQGERAKRVNAKEEAQVIIVAGLAGGTGAGIFLEVAAMVRDKFPNAKIAGKLVMPGVFRAADGGSKLKSNGYACLKEINHYFTHPYAAQWSANGPVVQVRRVYDEVYIYDGLNLANRVANSPGELYNTIGDTLFLDFFQGQFADDRRAYLNNRAPILMKMWKNVPQLSGDKWRIHGDTGGADGKVDRIALEEYPRKFNSSGISRLCTPAWRLLNQMSYQLAKDLLDCLDSREALLNDENALKREFAHKLGFYQGEIEIDGMKKRQYSVIEALGTYPSEGNDRARLSEEIAARFEDLNLEDQIQIFWDEKNCGVELGRRWNEVGASFAGLRDDRHAGLYTKRIRDNWRDLYTSVKSELQNAIEHFCEQPYMGPWRIKEVMERLATDIKVSDVFWIKEMEKRAVQAGARAAEYRNDWDRWSKLAAQADTAMTFFRRKPAFKQQIENAQEAAVNYWNAVAEEYIYEQTAELLQELSKVLLEEVERQNDMVERLTTMRTDFNAFATEYSIAGDSAVQVELELARDWSEDAFVYYLGDTDRRRKETLFALFERSKRELGIQTNLALRERLVKSKDGFARDLHHCCWRALHGKDGVTDWFGEEEPKKGLIVKAGFWEQLKAECGSERSPRLRELASTLIEQSLPWASLDASIHYDELPLDVCLVLPKSAPEDAEYVKAFKDAASEAFRALPGGMKKDLHHVSGSEYSEAVCYAELFAFIPASLKSLRGNSGLAAQFQRSSDKAKDNDPEGFLHTDLDTVQFDDLLPTGPQEADAVFEAWKLFLLGVMLRVIKSSPNALKPKEGEARRLAPVFSFTFRGRGAAVNQPLGQYQSAVSAIHRDANIRRQLQDMVNAEFISQPAVRYEKLLGLAKYYKQCIFPIRAPRPDSKEFAVATPPYVALTKIENESLASWDDAVRGGSASRFTSLKQLANSGPQQLLWSIREFAGHAGSTDTGAALKLGMTTTDDDGNFNYLEEPPGRDRFDVEGGPDKAAERLNELKDNVFELLPPDLARNGALREQNRYFPWLALAEWHEIFLPSRHGASPPDRKVKPPVRRKSTDEMTTVEIVNHFTDTPSDGATKKGGAQVWVQDAGETVGDWFPWTRHPRIKEAVDDAGLDLPEVSTGGGQAATPSPTGTPPVPPSPEVPLDYAIAGGQPEKITPSEIAARIGANPSAQHYVLVNNAWADARSVPEVQQAMAPPVPGGSPPVPPPPGPAIPPPPAQLAPIPPGPFTHFVHGVHSDWVQVSGADLVEQAVARPAGQEGHIYENGANVSVMDHPGLAAAIKDRRS